MTYSKKWTAAKILQFCEDNFIRERGSDTASVIPWFREDLSHIILTQHQESQAF